jgi:hypothetical protein
VAVTASVAIQANKPARETRRFFCALRR